MNVGMNSATLNLNFSQERTNLFPNQTAQVDLVRLQTKYDELKEVIAHLSNEINRLRAHRAK